MIKGPAEAIKDYYANQLSVYKKFAKKMYSTYKVDNKHVKDGHFVKWKREHLQIHPLPGPSLLSNFPFKPPSSSKLPNMAASIK